MSKYTSGFQSVIGSRRAIARVSDVLGAETALSKPSAMSTFMKDIGAGERPNVPDGVGTVVGGVAGALLMSKHRVLGAIGGASLGHNLPALLMHPERRSAALCNMAQTAGGITGSALFGKHRVIGFGLGWLAAGLALYLGGCWPAESEAKKAA